MSSLSFYFSAGPPLKRIKSESFASAVTSMKSESIASPLFTPNSLPPSASQHWGSPNGGPPSVLSPYSVAASNGGGGSGGGVGCSTSSPIANIQQQQRIGGPPSAPPSRYGHTPPVTPGALQNPPSVGGTTSPFAVGSTHSHLTVQQQSSVETISIAGKLR